MEKETALNWLKKKLESYGDPSNLKLDWETFDELIEQAKQMENEQIIESYCQGREVSEKYFKKIYGCDEN